MRDCKQFVLHDLDSAQLAACRAVCRSYTLADAGRAFSIAVLVPPRNNANISTAATMTY
jgi:hypothetical protein